MAIRHKRKTRDNWKEPEINADKVNRGFAKRKGTIMFPTTHDITTENLSECITVLRSMLSAGNRVLIVSKPVPHCINKLCDELEEFRDQILFRFSIGSANDSVLRFWEPGAPTYEGRIFALGATWARGFATSVSCEPMLDNRIENVVESALPYVTDSIWIGLPNMLKQRIALNCGDDETKARAKELMAGFTDSRIKELYRKYADHPKIKWKESIKKVVGLDRPDKAGLDV
jgi:DNA repair photolyase